MIIEVHTANHNNPSKVRCPNHRLINNAQFLIVTKSVMLSINLSTPSPRFEFALRPPRWDDGLSAITALSIVSANRYSRAIRITKSVTQAVRTLWRSAVRAYASTGPALSWRRRTVYYGDRAARVRTPRRMYTALTRLAALTPLYTGTVAYSRIQLWT